MEKRARLRRVFSEDKDGGGEKIGRTGLLQIGKEIYRKVEQREKEEGKEIERKIQNKTEGKEQKIARSY